MNKKIYAVIGGDERFARLAQMIAESGCTVFAAGLDAHKAELPGVIKTDDVTAAAMGDIVVLPLPASVDGAVVNAPFAKRAVRLDSELCDAMSHSRIYAGFASKLCKQQPAFEKMAIFDYSAHEPFLIRNAQATAEALIMLTIEKMPRVVAGSQILIAGCGRIGKFTAMLFQVLGAKVSAVSRGGANAAVVGAIGTEELRYKELPEHIGKFDAVINTADAMVFTEQLIREMKRECVIIDAASYPGGTDFAAAESCGITAVHALGLPGKYSPATAARIIYDTITEMEGET